MPRSQPKIVPIKLRFNATQTYINMQAGLLRKGNLTLPEYNKNVNKRLKALDKSLKLYNERKMKEAIKKNPTAVIKKDEMAKKSITTNKKTT